MDSETRQRLLELAYELLPEDEAAELRRRIESDAEMAAAYRQAQETARLLAEAARLPSVGIQVVPPGAAGDAVRKPSSVSLELGAPQPLKAGATARQSFARAANWMVGLAAAALVLISVGGYFYHREKLVAIAAEHLRLVVTGPSTIQTGIDTEYLVSTTAIDSQPLPAKVEVSLSTPDGKRLKAFKETADEHGCLRVTIPADLKLPPQTQFRVAAWHGESHEETESTLAVAPVRYDAQLGLDRPLYQPGDVVRYRSLVLSRFGLTADRDVPVHFEIHDPAGAVVAGSPCDVTSHRGVAAGEFVIPAELAGGQYTLIARAQDGTFRQQKRTFFVRRYRLPKLKKELEFLRDSYGPGQTVTADFKAQRAEGGAAAGAALRVVATVDGKPVFEQAAKTTDAGSLHVEFKLPDKIEQGDGQLAVIIDDGGSRETEAKTIPISLGKIDVSFYPEGGDLVPGLENRVYFVARNPQGKPVDLAGTLLVEEADGRSRVEESIPVKTVYEGMGAFRFRPTVGAVYRLKINEPVGVTNQPKLPAVSTQRDVVLDTGAGVFAAGKPLEFSVKAVKTGLPLVVAAYCRGVQVGEQPLVTKQTGDDPNPVKISLDGTVGGVIRLTVYNYNATPPKPIAERLVYRRPARKLNVQATAAGQAGASGQAGKLPHYAPGDKVDLSLSVTDESGAPTAAALGVAVVDDALLNLADDHAPSMPTYFLLTSEIDKPEDLENADFYLSDGTRGEAKAAEALDLLLGTQGWRRFAEVSLLAAVSGKGDSPVFAGAKTGTVPAMSPEQLATLALVGAGRPPLMYDNIEQIRSNYKKSLAAYQADRTRALNTLTAISFFGGLGLVLLVVMLGLMRIVSGMHLWIPAVGATVCCLIIGAILMNPDQLTPAQGNAVAFLSWHAPTPKIRTVVGYGSMPYGITDLMIPERVELEGLADMQVPRDLDRKDLALFGMRLNEGDHYRLLRGELRLNRAGFAADRRWGVAEGRILLADGVDKLGLDRRYVYNAEDLLRKRRADEGEDGAKMRYAKYPISFREYAHLHVADKSGVRSDFTETLYWNPLLVADADGRASVRFDLSDAVTAFRLTADAHGNGRIGSGRAEIVSRIPFHLDPKLPLEVNAGDRIDLPVAVVNDTKKPLPVELKLDYSGKLVTLEGSPSTVGVTVGAAVALPHQSNGAGGVTAVPTSVRKLTLTAEQRGREYFVLNVTGEKGRCDLKLLGKAGDLTDAVSRPLRIVPPGFPKVASYSGQLSGPQELVVKLPEHWVPGSLDVSLNVFPSSFADIQKGLSGILQEPNGCFEQASTSNYPNVMTMQYLQEHGQSDPDLARRTKDLLKKGYARLSGYECKQRGYEWFGGDPGHEALTAYGLMQFRDMQKVFEVDPTMIGRTAEWLLARRDGHGGFQRNPKALDSFGQAPAEVTDAYITWALSESGQSGIDAEVKHAIELGRKLDDSYVLALAAAAALNANQKDEGRKLLEKLAKGQADDGHLDSRQGSITRSGGQSLQVETTALAALAWLKSPEFTGQANKAIQWIVGQRQGGGGFGSTQATILALKALVTHAEANRRAANAGKLTIERDGKLLGQHTFSAGVRETIAIDGIEAALIAGDNRLTVNLTGDNRMPYVLNVSYRTLKPESSEACPVRLVTKLAAAKVKAGEMVALSANLSNPTDKGQPMTVAIVGLPAGLEPRADQLEELKKAGVMDYYETGPREVIFYWRGLAPKRQVAVKLDLLAAVPGKYTAPASRAYLYYTPENKQWCDPLTVEIAR
jgi:alpha-2-macroglobulin-like protein